MEIIDYTNKTKEVPNTEKIEVTQVEQRELPINKSADVFNALNLYNEDLGRLYENEGYNPFEKDFKLDEEFAKDILEIKSKKSEVFPETFLEANNKNISKNFEIAIENNNALLNEMQNKLSSNLSPKDKKQVQKMIITLKNRGELLKLNKEKLKQKDANALKMYLDIYGLDSELSDLLGDNYTQKVNAIILAQKMLDLCKSRAIMSGIQKLNIVEKQVAVEQTQTKEVEQVAKHVEQQQTKTTEQVTQKTKNVERHTNQHTENTSNQDKEFNY